ncbi:hypothetical protein Desfe_1165 [Desulfurococcus amylolyticus DSM 16532]|uniref:Uncharacterized protein n=1 Tax=Desulfurococcus amylolyticus DSM 16532 TaxID=768672 RepID=I3XSW2_DESAM|nr:hypothetical protein [Desulfurococcus amylolyticus]AFL67036.1 hypothetical protein Desfe_1165 [Desulfurococcus amylolyticus DSM 16532]
MSKPGIISEYYFSDYYRVIVIEEGDSYIVSVDVYRSKWIFTDYTEKCVENTCLLLKELSPESNGNRYVDLDSVSKIIIIGVKVDDNYETINVKWVLRKKPTYSDIESLYEASWRIIGCHRGDCWRES